MSETVVTKRLVIYGRVQGVYYRHSMRQRAQQLQINGWVCNRSDGTVEAMVQGAQTAVEAIIEWAWQGPEMAKVTDVQIEEAVSGQFDRFDTLPSK